MKTLGLDLGTNSLGWAVVEDDSILRTGVVVFPEGTDEGNNAIDTPAATRRGKRQTRRQIFRRKLRKQSLLNILIRNQMCPVSPRSLEEWKRTGKFPANDETFVNWLASTPEHNPYLLRKRAVEENLQPEELGRAIYHLAQRRGFKSSRKDQTPEDDKDLGKVKGGIAELSKTLADRGQTLGQYFYDCYKGLCDGEVGFSRIRGRYTGRNEHYEVEFQAIADRQQLSPTLREELHRALFAQRPLRSQKHLVGKCLLEKNSSRCLISHPLFEEYRMYSLLGNVKIAIDESLPPKDKNLRPLSDEEFQAAVDFYQSQSRAFDFKRLAKAINKKATFNYKDNQTLSPCKTLSILRAILGDDRSQWQQAFDAMIFFDDDAKLEQFLDKHFPQLDQARRDAFIKARLDEGYAEYSLKAIKKILPYLKERYDLSQARFFAKLEGIIPDFTARKADILASLVDARSRFSDAKALSTTKGYNVKAGSLINDYYKVTLMDQWGVSEKDFNTLYLTTGTPYDVDAKETILPPVQLGMIRNPIAQRAMTVMRRLINTLSRLHLIDKNTKICLELARSVNNWAMRDALASWQKKNEQKRQDIAKAIKEYGLEPTDDLILRYQLAEEQDNTCIYTGKKLSIDMILSPGTPFDIEHTIPRSRSGDNSTINKTLCDWDYNRNTKKGQLPSECPNYEDIMARLKPWKDKVTALENKYAKAIKSCRGVIDPLAHSRSRSKALLTKFELDYWRRKVKTFTMSEEDVQKKGFMNRQLVDTGIMTRHAIEFLRSVYPDTYPVNGDAVALARKAWGVQGDTPKSRNNHTHHAVDAITIAYLNPYRFMTICAALKDDGQSHQQVRTCCPPPFEGFNETLRSAVSSILAKFLIKHCETQKTIRRSVTLAKPVKTADGRLIRTVPSINNHTVRGQLSKETFYGCIMRPNNDPTDADRDKESTPAYVIRKSLDGLKEGDIAKIVDPIVRQKVREQYDAYIAQGEKSPLALHYWMKTPSGSSAGVPIKKVRIYAKVAEPHKLKMHDFVGDKEYKTPYYVDTGDNLRMALYCQQKANGATSWATQPENLLHWAQNHHKPDYVAPEDQTKLGTFLGYIQAGTMALLYNGSPDELKTLSAKELAQRLYRVTKFEKSGRTTLRLHTEARPATVLSQDLKDKGLSGTGASEPSYTTPMSLLYVSPSKFCNFLLFEGIHFTLTLDGRLSFIHQED